MTRRHRQPLTPHRFIPGAVKDWNDRPFCDRCGMYRSNRIHTEYVEPETDDSRILGEGGGSGADAA